MRMCVSLAAIALACRAPASPPSAPSPLPLPSGAIAFGPLSLRVVASRDASLFHAVDQMSAWYPYHHRIFDELTSTLSEAERAALARHRDVRASHPWGSGLEAAFYLASPSAIDSATMATEREVLAGLDATLASYLADVQPHVAHFAETIRAPIARAAPTLAAVGRLFEAAPREIAVVVVARPGHGVGGGGANGGVLVIEVTVDEQSTTALIHEASHNLLANQRAALAAVARACGHGLDEMTVEEGLAHAIAPGLVHDGPDHADPLADAVEAGRGLPFTGVTRFYDLAAAVRPALARALADGTAAARARLLDELCPAWIETSTRMPR